MSWQDIIVDICRQFDFQALRTAFILHLYPLKAIVY